jgi:hypothetical protein
MRGIAPSVERFCRTFEGCQTFDLNFPADRPGVLLATELRHSTELLRAHIGPVTNAPDLQEWNDLLTSMKPAVFTAEPLDLAHLVNTDHPM